MARVPVKKRIVKRQAAKRGPTRAAPTRRPPRRRAPPAPRRPINTIVPSPRTLDWAFNAFDKRHLPLDEVTAPYTVSSFTSILEFTSSHTEDQVILVCPFQNSYSGIPPGNITDTIAAVYNGSTADNTMTSTKTCRSPILGTPAPASTDTHFDVRARLHNLSVKVQCLGTSAGLYPPGSVYYGTVPALETGAGQSAHAGRTLQQVWVEDSIAVGYLLGVPAVSLMKEPGVVHSTVCETISYKNWSTMSVPPSSLDIGTCAISMALEPIVISVPKCGAAGTTVNYRIIIAQQWCTRHPNNVLLRSTQKQHNATAPGVWHKALTTAKSVTTTVGEGLATGAMEALGRAAASILRPQAAIAPPLVVD